MSNKYLNTMKKHLLVMLMALLCVPWAARAQEELTVYDGSSSQSNNPFYGYFADGNFLTQAIYPADSLASMAGSTITSMTFYSCGESSYAPWNENYNKEFDNSLKIWLMETTESDYGTTYSPYFKTMENATLVYEGSVEIEDGLWTITFSTPFTYSGGNLLMFLLNDEFASDYAYTYWVSSSTSGGNTQAIYKTYASIYDVDDVEATTSGTKNSYMPKTTFGYGSGSICAAVRNLAASNISETGATVTWDSVAGARYAVFVDGVQQDDQSGNTLTLTGLSASSQHTVQVQTLCAAGDSSSVRTLRFRTLCASTIALPTYEDFESAQSGMPDCWTLVRSTSTGYPTTYASGGNKSLYFYSYSYGSYYDYYNNPQSMLVRMESTPVSLNQLHVNFRAKFSDDQAKLQMGYMTNPNDSTSFVPLRIIPYSENRNTWTEYDCYFDTVTYSGNAWLAFRYAGTYYSQDMYLDDVLVEQASSCRRPTAAAVSGVTFDEATVSWTVDPQATSVTGYEVRYATRNDVNATDYQTVYSFGESSVTLSGLQPNTRYYAWVRANCDADNTQWRSAGSFTTDLLCYPVTNATVYDVGYKSATIQWAYGYAGRGHDLQEVVLTLTCTSDSNEAPVSSTYTGTTAMLTGLSMGQSYRVTLTPLCENPLGDPDTATTVTLNFSTNGCGEVTTDPAYGTPSTSSSYPFYTYSYYGSTYKSVSMSLYPTSALNGLDSIRGLQWHTTTTAGGTATLDVYLGYVNKTSFASSSDWIPASAFTQVASGATFTKAQGSTGWVGISFDSAFAARSDSAMLAVAVIMNSHTFTSSLNWANHQTGSYSGGNYSSIYNYSSSYTYTIDNPNQGYSNSNTYYRPNIRFTGDCDISCFAPQVTVGTTTAYNVTLNINPGDDESQWAIQYRADTTNIWADGGLATSTTWTVENLDPGTRYSFRAGTVCGDDTLFSRAATATTACVPIEHSELPYATDFNSYSTSSTVFDPCWKNTYGDYSTGYAYISSGGRESSNGLYIYPGYAPNYTDVVLPAFDYVNDLTVRFWLKKNANHNVYIGVATDPNDMSTFEQVQQLTTASDDWQEFDVDLNTISTTDAQYIVFRTVYNGSSYGGSTYIDDLSVQEIQGCARPGAASATNVSATGATIAWTDANAVGSYAIDYYILPDTANINTYVPSADDVTTSAGISDTSDNLIDLTPNRTYVVKVYGVCHGERSDARTISFQTPCLPLGLADLPMRDDLESYTGSTNTCWKLFAEGISGSAPDIFTRADYAASGTRFLRFTESSYNSYAALNGIDSDVTDVELSFKARVDVYSDSYSGNCVLKLGYMTNPSDYNTFVATTTYNLNSTSFENYSTYSTAFANTTGSTIYPTICWRDSYSYLCVDDILIEQGLPCAKVQSMTLSNITDTSARVSWTDTNSTATHEIVWYDTADRETLHTLTGIAGTSQTIGQMAANRVYVVSVYTLCGAERSNPFSDTLRTACPAIATLPDTINFDNNYTLDCWRTNFALYYSTTGMGISPSLTFYPAADYQPTVDNTASHSGNASLKISQYWYGSYYNEYNDGMACALLPLYSTPTPQLQVSFWYKVDTMPSTHSIQVGTLADIADISTMNVSATRPTPRGTSTPWLWAAATSPERASPLCSAAQATATETTNSPTPTLTTSW